MDALLTVMRSGVPLDQVYDLPLDVFYLMVESAGRLEAKARIANIHDMTMTIGSSFSKEKKHLEEYIKVIEESYVEGGDGTG